MPDLIRLIKRAALEAVENGQPTDIRQGIVTNNNPLTVQITPQLILPASVLIVPKHLTDYTVKVSFNWTTEEAGSHNHTCPEGTTSSVSNHSHTISSGGDKEITIHNALQINDKVALLRQKGGQFYYILDRI